ATVSGIRYTGEQVYTAVPINSQPMCRNIYTIDTTVIGHLETHPASLGVVFAQAFSQPGISADEVIANVKAKTASDPNLPKLTVDEREAVYEVPITLVAHANEISQTKP